MSELSISPLERSRKAYSNVLQAMQDPGTQRNLAQIMGTSESTISRAKNTLEDALALMYHLGFKVVSADCICVDRKRYEALETIEIGNLESLNHIGSNPPTPPLTQKLKKPNMTLLECIVFSDWLLKAASILAKPYNWIMNARMMFVAYGDCLATPEEYEISSLQQFVEDLASEKNKN